VVGPEHGTPFLTTNQVFDIRPAIRKWLAASYVPDIEQRYLLPGWVLITCSGNGVANNVGKVLASYAAHAGAVVSHDLLRVQLNDARDFGWVYAFLRSRWGCEMLRSSQYGSAIKHLEPEHIEPLPIPHVPVNLRTRLGALMAHVFQLRSEAYASLREAEEVFGAAFGSPPEVNADEPFTVRSTAFAARSRRLDGYHYNQMAEAIARRLRGSGYPMVPLASVTDRVFLPNRFVRVFKERGIPFLDSEDVFKVNPDITKFIPAVAKPDAADYAVHAGWLLLARSGQIYGNTGSVALATHWHEGKIISEDLIRIVPSGDIRPGYLAMALGHPVFGRPLVLRWAFGSGVPHIAPGDLREFPVVRLGEAEASIADKIEGAANMRAEADDAENGAVALLESALRPLFGASLESDEDRKDAEVARRRLTEIANDPTELISGEELERRLKQMEH